MSPRTVHSSALPFNSGSAGVPSSHKTLGRAELEIALERSRVRWRTDHRSHWRVQTDESRHSSGVRFLLSERKRGLRRCAGLDPFTGKRHGRYGTSP